MLIYMIPFILLLVVAIILKKREANKQAETGSASKVKSQHKKANSTKKIVPKTRVVADSIIDKKKTTALTENQRSKIETLIRERNFFSAEAQINQALNKDNSQHELYLLLLEIHILEKDEFAISQLMNHLRSLGSDELLEQALTKKLAYDQADVLSKDRVDFDLSPTIDRLENSQTENFDSFLSKPSTNAAPPSNPHLADPALSFDQLHQNSDAASPATIEHHQPLDFKSFSFDTPTTEPKKLETAAVDEIKALDFSSLSLAPQSSPVAPLEDKLEQETLPSDFSFDIDTQAQQQITILDEPVVTQNVVDEKPEFHFDFSAKESVTPVEIEQPIFDPKPDLDFNLEELNNLTQQAIITTNPSTPVLHEVVDPLLRSFPELSQVNEINLNLELAEKYIQLGAFESARELLTENTHQYTSEQRQSADQLRNQIAS